MFHPFFTMQVKSKRQYKTHMFKHEDNPKLKEMRAEWKKKFWMLMDTPNKVIPKAWKEELWKEQRTLWSHRELMCYEEQTQKYIKPDLNYYELYYHEYFP